MDSLPPSRSSPGSPLRGKRPGNQEQNADNTRRKKSKAASGKAIAHRHSTVAETESVFSESFIAKSVWKEKLQHKITTIFNQKQTLNPEEILKHLGFSNVSEHRVDWLLALIELLKESGQYPDLEYFYRSPLSEALSYDVLQAGCHIDSLLEKLQRSNIPPSGRGRLRQWDIRAILDTSPKIVLELYSRSDVEEQLLLEQVSEGNYRNLNRLKLLAMCSDQWAIHYVKVRLEQGIPLNDVRREAKKNQLLLPRINCSKPTSFFKGLLFYLSRDSKAYQALLIQAEPKWLKAIEDCAAYPEVLQALIKARLKEFSPGRILDELNSVYPPLVIPGGHSSWAKYLADTLPVEARAALGQFKSNNQRGGKYKKWLRVELQEKLLTMLLDLGNGSDEVKLRKYAMCLYQCFGHLALVADSLNKDKLTGGSDVPWTTDAVMNLLTINPTQLSLHSQADGTFVVSELLLREDSSAVLSHASVVSALNDIEKADYAQKGPSQIEGVPFGVLCKRSLEKGTVVGEYKGAVTKRMELSSELRQKYAQLTSTPLKKMPDELALLWHDQPDIAFHTESDLYVAWCPNVIMSETVLGNDEPVKGVKTALGINGARGGDFIKELNHSDTPNCVLMVAIDPEAIDWIDLEEGYHLKSGVDLQKAFRLVVVTTERIDPKDGAVELTFDYTGCGKTPLFKNVGADVAKKPETLLSLPQAPWGAVQLHISDVNIDLEGLSTDKPDQDIVPEPDNGSVQMPSLSPRGLSSPVENMETESGSEVADPLVQKKHCGWKDEVRLSLEDRKKLAVMENCDFMSGKAALSDLPETFLPNKDNLPSGIRQYWEKSYTDLRTLYQEATNDTDKEQIILAYGLKGLPTFRTNDMHKLIRLKFTCGKQALPGASHINDVAFFTLMNRYLLSGMKYNQMLEWLPYGYLCAHTPRDHELMDLYVSNRKARGMTLSKIVANVKRIYKENWTPKDLENRSPSLVDACRQLTDDKIRQLELSADQDDNILLMEWARMGNQKALKAFIRTWLYRDGGLSRICIKLRAFQIPLPGDASQFSWHVKDIETLMSPEDIDHNHEDLPWVEKPESVLVLHYSKGSRDALKAILSQAIKQRKLTPSHLRNKNIQCPCGSTWTTITIAASLKYLFPDEPVTTLDTATNQALYERTADRKKQVTSPERIMLLIRAYLGDDEALCLYFHSSLMADLRTIVKDLNEMEFPPPGFRKKWTTEDVRDCLDLLPAGGAD